MTTIIKIRNGLAINLEGKAELTLCDSVSYKSEFYAIFPDDFPGFVPKICVKPGDRVLAGTALMYDKNRPEIKLTSPVSGTIELVNRGEKRKLLNVIIKADKENEYLNFGEKDLKSMTPEEIKSLLAETGIFAFIRQRPYAVIANPKDIPRDIFVTGFCSAPLAPDFEIQLNNAGESDAFQTGLTVLAMLTSGKVYLGICNTAKLPCLKEAKNVEIVTFEGPHPAGNVSVQLNHIKPVNKGEIVWTMNASDVSFIGRLFLHEKVVLDRLVALTGSEVPKNDRTYYHSTVGVCLEDMVKNCTEQSQKHLRYTSGNVLTGTQIPSNGFLHAFDNQVTVIPEGDETHDFLGWITPGFDKFSMNRSFPAFIVQALTKKAYKMDARIKGGRRAMIMSNEWDKVFPMDIHPEFLVRAILSKDIEKMEDLGIYEVAPEDFALCEFVDTSKMELQAIVRQGLDWLYKELS
ncbi:MAG: Na(+)-translocating NADH-quinone reductase subunit A [Dysgonamonadaceae bacterium]|jgi:Na+-transporting NADH:ubiquinone oxidoreductase subunit A|nr:Na(+)-translocating NADH-quinone reductase subunit A [Dysgonamonadaceae bacterium]